MQFQTYSSESRNHGDGSAITLAVLRDDEQIHVEIDGEHLDDLSEIGEIRTLEHLTLQNVRDLHDLRWISELEGLESLRFQGRLPTSVYNVDFPNSVIRVQIPEGKAVDFDHVASLGDVLVYAGEEILKHD